MWREWLWQSPHHVGDYGAGDGGGGSNEILNQYACIFLRILIWSASQVGWPRITHYSFSHLEGNWVSRVVNWSRVGFELRTPVFWSGAVSVGVIAFKLWCVEMLPEAIVMDGDGGGAQGPTSCLKWNRSPSPAWFTGLMRFYFIKGFWRSQFALCVTKPCKMYL